MPEMKNAIFRRMDRGKSLVEFQTTSPQEENHMSKAMSAKALMKKKEAADAKEAKRIQEQARKLTELREAKRKKEVELNALIREA